MCPRITPPGNVWYATDYLAVLTLIFGAFHAARTYPVRPVFMLYGCLGACAFLDVLLPDGRDYLAIGMGRDNIERYLIRICVFIPAMGLACLSACWVRQRLQKLLERPAPEPRCRNCGYLLYGLARKRCPECGLDFHEDIPPVPTNL